MLGLSLFRQIFDNQPSRKAFKLAPCSSVSCRGKSMCEIQGQPAVSIRRVREFAITAAIVIGGLLMLAGSIYGVVLHPGGPEELGAFWPLYLGGLVAILLGWMNGDLAG